MTVDVDVRRVVKGGVGESVTRPDGTAKLQGRFAYAQDLYRDDMLWGATCRSPHPHARILSIDIAPALAIPGVHAVLTADDVPGLRTFGLDEPDQPVLADQVARYWGEPVAIVAADDPGQAARAAETIVVSYEELDPLTDPEEADRLDSVFRRLEVRRGEDMHGEVVVEGFYETSPIDQAPLGTEAGLAIPDGEGGVDLFATSQWLHADHSQVVASLGLRPEQVRCRPTGIGGAFGSREDLNLHIHLCMLALHTRRPVKMTYGRDESFVGHVHRHPARMWYRHEADREGNLMRVEAKVLLDGGAYASTSAAVMANATYFAVGPYRCDSVRVDGIAARTNNPPAGAMRGFGAVQACFGYESQMDRMAAALGMDPIEFRLQNALQAGDPMPTTGQVIEGSLPSREVLESLLAIPLPDRETSDDPLHLPGGTGLTTRPEHVRRGTGYGFSIKNLAFSEGFDDYAEARVVITSEGVEVHTAAVEVGQGMVTVLAQIARSVLGIERVTVLWDDTSAIGSAGSTSASRQTQMTGGAVYEAAAALRTEVLDRFGGDRLDDRGVWKGDDLLADWEEVCREGPVSHHVTFRHPPTTEPDEHGQGNIHAGFAVAAHRAVVDVDVELGLVRVVRVDTAQDVGKVLNRQALIGQVEGGILQGVGMGMMEELLIADGKILNASFTDYLLPTILDAPATEAILIEEPDHWGPFGAKGVGEPPTISSVPAVVAAIRDATGKELTRAPVRPEDIAL
ncbi:MAG: xanthine dehydrogenase family protein molybdopterin-binding subunit [Acidimicrobiia bacterium]